MSAPYNPTGSAAISPFAEFLNEENIITIISITSFLFLVLPALAGTGLGLKESASGIAAAAEIKIEFTSVMAALCFLTTPVIYMMLLFFLFNDKNAAHTKLLPNALVKMVCCLITGFGSYYTAYTIGCMTKHVLVTKVKEKKFSGQFYLGFVFVEFIGLFALIISLLLRGQYNEK